MCFLMTVKRSGVLLCAALLCACTGPSTKMEDALLGKSRSDVVACAGVPDRDELHDGQEVLVWTQEAKGANSFSLTTPFNFALSVNMDGNCKVIVAVKKDRVWRVGFSGKAGGWRGEDSVCRLALRSCLRRRDPIAPDNGYRTSPAG